MTGRPRPPSPHRPRPPHLVEGQAPAATAGAGLSAVQRWVLLAALAVAIWLLWSTPVVYPLKILVVLFHELSHAAAALATGGSVVGIEVVAAEGGVCRTVGGSPFWILSAGYLGSLLAGGLILVAAVRSRRDREIAVALGLMLLAAGLVWVRPVVSFGFAFTLAAAAALTAAGLYLPAAAVDVLLQGIGLTSMLYAVLDIRDDILARPHLLESDAAQLARLTGVPTLVWGVLWAAAGLAAAVGFVRWAGGPSQSSRA